MKKKIIKKDKMFFAQKAFVFDKDGKFLAMRRTKTAPANALKWDLPGGDIEFGEDPIKSIQREIKEETGFVVNNPIIFDIEAHINSQGEYWVTGAFRAFNPKGKLFISWEHDLYKWVTVDEFLKLKISKKLRRFANTLKKNKF